jgi:hypothetical protein
VASVLLLLLHVPPPASLKPIVAPTQTCTTPLIAEGRGLTVIKNVEVQPATVYEILVEPVAAAVTTPDELPIVATDGLLLTQTPPDVASPKVVVPFTQSVLLPEIIAGAGFTVTTPVVVHPVPNE